MFLDFSIWTFESPKIAQELALPVSANSYTGVCELVYLAKSRAEPKVVNIFFFFSYAKKFILPKYKD